MLAILDSTARAQKIESARFGKAISQSDQLSDLGTKFEPNQTIILKVSLDSRPDSGVLSCKFYLAKQHITTVSADLAELASNDLPDHLNAYGVFSLKPTAPFPVSDAYRAEIYLDDKQLGRFAFEVEDARTNSPGAARTGNTKPGGSERDTATIVDTLLRATAYVHATDETGNSWTGTAWVLDQKQRLLVTNDHVASSTTQDGTAAAVASIKLIFPEYVGGRVIHDAAHYRRHATPIDAKVIYSDKTRDLAILQAESLPSDNTTALKLASVSTSLGDSLHSLGGVPRGSEGYWIYTSGEVRAVYKRSLANGYDAQTVEANMQTNQGNSGGPVVNNRGELVAVVEGHQTNARSVSLYIDLAEVKQFIAESESLVSPKSATDFVRRGDHHYEAGRLDDALSDYTRALRIAPENAEAMASRGWVFYSKGDNQTALLEFNDAIEADKMMLYAYHGRATIRSEQGDYDAAIHDLTYAITNASEQSDASEFYNERGVAYWRMDDLTSALADFERAIDAYPSNAWAHYNRGNVLATDDQHSAAIEAFAVAIDLSPDEADFYWLMGKSADAIGKSESAMKLFDTAIALDATQADYLISKAKLYAGENDFTSASKLLLAAIEIDESDSRVVNEVGLFGFEIGNYPMAEIMFSRASELDTSDATTWFNLGHAQLKQHKWSAAIRHLTKSIELDSKDGDAYSLRGEAYSAAGNTNMAKQDFAKAKMLLPGALDRYSTKLLKIGNRVQEKLEVHVRYRAKGTDGERRWYPQNGQTLTFTFEPNEVAYVTHGNNQIHGDQFQIWAIGSESGATYSDYKTKKLLAVGANGYLSASGEPDTELFQFVDKQ
ncbi:MAG: hypothetical protein Aurels2KO_45710 [Aureliella sp.]